MKRRWLVWTAGGVLTLVVAVAGFTAWVINTSSGTRWAFARVTSALGGALIVGQIDGTLAGPLTLNKVRYIDLKKAGIDITIERVLLDIDVRDLLQMTAHVANAEVSGIKAVLSEPTEPPPDEDTPFTLEAPIDVIVDRFRLSDAQVSRDQELLVQVDSAALVARWVGANVIVRELDVQSPQGEVHFAADVREREYFEGEGRGRFRWRVGERTFAGTLEGNSPGERTNVIVKLTAPLDATLTAELQQREDLPWQFSLDAPAFDPREELLPDSSLQSLAAQLTGRGSLREGEIAGVVTINNETIQIERAHFAKAEQAIALDSTVLFGGGRINAKGEVFTAQAPVGVKLALTWQDLVVPATLAGQELFSGGQIDVDGNADTYRAVGKMKLGPKDRIAALELKVQGSPSRVDIEQFDVVQNPGRLALNGRVDLQPQLGWQMQARARRFDPGAFAVAWKGSLNFDLKSDGSVIDSAPQGTLVLKDLNGRLRNRELAGNANLSLSAGMVLAGDLDLRSGRSRIRVEGRGANRDTMNAVATIEVPSVNDWLPDGDGELNGRIEARGRWPDLNITGNLQGNDLKIATLRAATLTAQWNVDRPLDPSGSLELEATQIRVGSFAFDRLRANAQGNAGKHTLDFDADGSPLATAFLVEGARDGRGWKGNVQRLTLDVKDAAQLALQRPVAVTYSPELVRISEACFADRDIRLCVEGDRQASGALHARYNLQNVPLGLANSFASSEMPLVFAGTLDGRGDIESNADGVFKGHADIRSASGRISRQFEATADAPEVLLTYNDLNLVADLDGANARARLAARLNDTGSLQGQVALSGLAEPVTNIDGEVTANLPSLRVIELFVPQLANVQGQADLRASVRGTLDAPQLGGEFRALNVATDVPEFGLKLRNGRLSVSPAGEAFKIAGGIGSGPGTIEFAGTATTAGAVDMKVDGKQFQAADIPGASVLIDPNLKFVRESERMQLSGEVNIPVATIDLQKLPRKERTQNASSDVVIIDATTQEEAEAQAMPVFATVKVTLGEKVALVGYGLDAKVDGQLTVNEQPGSPTTGSGEVRVAGTYKAYGQDLTIRQGQLLFAGTPLDNPRLNIIAVREVDDITAGLRITGSAQSPQLVVFSDPSMGQSNALAYLVTGKPLSEVGTGEGEGDALQSAARSLSTAAGGLLAKNIGQRLGVDELGIKDSEMIGGAALTVGQYLSPRLYLSYGVGLFEPGEVITLRYKLSKELALEALNGPEDSRAGIEYRKER